MLGYATILIFYCLCKRCFCVDNEAEVYGPGHGLFEQSSNTELRKDIELFREILPDTTEESLPADSSPFLQQTVNDEYAMLISNLAQADDKSFRTMLDAIQRALEMAFLKTSGKVDVTFVDRVINMIKNEVDQKRRLKFEQLGRGPMNPYPYPGY